MEPVLELMSKVKSLAEVPEATSLRLQRHVENIRFPHNGKESQLDELFFRRLIQIAIFLPKFILGFSNV